jgi:hypothetical protein
MVSPKLMIVRLLPVLLLTMAAAAYVVFVEGDNSYAIRNLVPLAAVVVLALITLGVGDGKWHGAGWRWPLGLIGFAIPSIGLSIYLHYAFATNLDDMFGSVTAGGENAAGVFRYLPLYTAISGAFGFAIGWIIGSRV